MDKTTPTLCDLLGVKQPTRRRWFGGPLTPSTCSTLWRLLVLNCGETTEKCKVQSR